MKSSKITIIAILYALSPSASWATLGGDASSINNDMQALQGSNNNKSTSLLSNSSKIPTVSENYVVAPNTINKYTSYQFKTNKGLIVNEYLTQNKVFSVTWQGAHASDLHQLLGNYYNEALNSKQKASPYFSLHISNINTNNLQFERSVYGNFYKGKVILKGYIPQGINIGEIK